MKNNDLVFWRDVPIKIRHKFYHIRKIGGTGRYAFANDYGDIPVGRFNFVTNKFEEVENHRGLAYGARRRLRYRKT